MPGNKVSVRIRVVPKPAFTTRYSPPAGTSRTNKKKPLIYIAALAFVLGISLLASLSNAPHSTPGPTPVALDPQASPLIPCYFSPCTQKTVPLVQGTINGNGRFSPDDIKNSVQYIWTIDVPDYFRGFYFGGVVEYPNGYTAGAGDVYGAQIVDGQHRVVCKSDQENLPDHIFCDALHKGRYYFTIEVNKKLHLSSWPDRSNDGLAEDYFFNSL